MLDTGIFEHSGEAAIRIKENYHMFGGMHSGLYGGMGGLGWVGGLLAFLLFVGFVIILVGAAVWLWRRGSLDRKTVVPGGSSAQALLDERYARGELSREEYLQIRDDIV